MSDRIRKPQICVALSQKKRPISRYDAQLLNTFLYMYTEEDEAPSGTKVTVSKYIVPRAPLSRSESAIYKELYEVVGTEGAGDWAEGLTFPLTVPAYDLLEEDQKSFAPSLGKYELELYYSIKAMLDADVKPR